MRISHRIFLAFVLVAFCLRFCAAESDQLVVRQDGGDGTATATQASATAATNTRHTATAASTESTDGQSGTATGGSAVATSATHSTASAAATTTASSTSPSSTEAAPVSSGTTTGSAAEASSTAAVYSGHGLPIQPKITPAIGIAGIILMATGVVYTLIGIKKRRILISLSTAYLVALAITVLIIYVMNPPVSDAVQGGFFVAAFLTGVVFGGVALIFPDLTDGLGCLLGGFCLSMWFLVLKAGGLIPSTTGKVIFIVGMSVVGFALSFSHYTRNYGTIFCTSFAGATAIILGVDCFSRAGLKEFWLYIWALNGDTFPLNTNTYPITRGIRVEIACIVVICLLGLFSQFRFWKVVKAKREAQAEKRREQEREREEEEEKIGRKVEKAANRERRQWEAVYGTKGATATHTDSGIGSTTESIRKGATSVREYSRSNSEDGMEMDDLGRGTRDGSEQDLMSRRQSETAEGEIQRIDADGNPIPGDYFSSRHSSATQRTSRSVRKQVDPTISTATPEEGVSASVPPPVVPLPFIVPTGDDDATSPTIDRLSMASLPPHDHNRLSVMSGNKRLSGQTTSTSRESLLVPHVEDDARSSIAATLDDMNEDVYSLPPLSPVVLEPVEVPLPPSPFPGDDLGTQAFPGLEPETQNDRTPKDQDAQDPRQDFPESGPPHSLTKSTDPAPADGQSSKRSSLQERRRHSGASRTTNDANQGSMRPRTHSDATPSVNGSLTDQLPDKLSKVMLSYRTNEWAKHLTLAEHPELESLPEPEPSSPGVLVDHSFSQAVESPTKAREENGPSARSSREIPQSPSTNPYRRSLTSQAQHESPVPLSRQDSGTIVSPPRGKKPAAQRSSSATLSPIHSARPGSSAAGRGIRSSSTPLMNVAEQTVVESPMEEHEEEGREGAYTPSPMPSNTLMGRRELLINSKMATMSFAAPNIAISSPSDSGSVHRGSHDGDSDNLSLAECKQMLEQDDLPLSKRKQLIQQQQQQQQRLSSQNLQRHSHQSQQRASTNPWAAPMQKFDSHQPKRSPTGLEAGKREVMMANWRQSVRQDLQQPMQTTKTDDGHRRAMIESARNQQMQQQQQSMAASYRESKLDSMMRRGDMLDLHQQALRRMQAAANKHA